VKWYSLSINTHPWWISVDTICGINTISGIQVAVGCNTGRYVGYGHRLVCHGIVEDLIMILVRMPVELGCDSIGISTSINTGATSICLKVSFLGGTPQNKSSPGQWFHRHCCRYMQPEVRKELITNHSHYFDEILLVLCMTLGLTLVSPGTKSKVSKYRGR